MIARYAVAFFLLMAIVVVPIVVFLLCRYFLPRRWGKKVGVVLSLLIIMLALYGMFVGYQDLEIKHIEFVSKDLPDKFDGYRIVQFSDAHVGTMTGSRQWLMERAVDSILAQHADMIVFTGDLQNVYPEDIIDHMPQFKRLKAPDGMYSVLGNHDYAIYQSVDSLAQEASNAKTQALERVRKTLAGVNPASFVVMLQHDPTAWRELILPQCNAQLTLSGHTHGGQAEVFGLSPAAFGYKEWKGWVYDGPRAMFISTGLGALIPFRLGLSGEIVVITLRKEK